MQRPVSNALTTAKKAAKKNKNRFEIDFRIRLKISTTKTETDPVTNQFTTRETWTTTHLDSDYVYSLFNQFDEHREEEELEVEAGDFMNPTADVKIVEFDKKLDDFEREHSLYQLCPVFTKTNPTNGDWKAFIDYVFILRHFFWSSEIPAYQIEHVKINKTTPVDYTQFKNQPIFTVGDEKRFSCIPQLFLNHLIHDKQLCGFANKLCKKYKEKPMTLQQLESELANVRLSVYILDLFGNVFFSKVAFGTKQTRALVAQLVTKNGLLHLTDVCSDQTKLLGRCIAQKVSNGKLNLESCDFLHNNFSIDHVHGKSMYFSGDLENIKITFDDEGELNDYDTCTF
jgi:hypothetical protein